MVYNLDMASKADLLGIALQPFWANIQRTEDGGCWLWTGIKTDGYGRITFGPGRMYAHRLSYLHHKGKIPDGKVLHHICNNRACVNPDHLVPVSRPDNASLMREADRHFHKLDKDSIRAIIDLYATRKYTQAELAHIFHCSQTHIGRITLTGKAS